MLGGPLLELAQAGVLEVRLLPTLPGTLCSAREKRCVGAHVYVVVYGVGELSSVEALVLWWSIESAASCMQ